MSKKGLPNRPVLLQKLRDLCRQGQAENEPVDEGTFLKNFLPIQSHYRVLDPDVRIIIGDKGAGKTQLFRALEFDRGREALARLAEDKGQMLHPLAKTRWLIGFQTSGTEFPPGGVIADLAKDRAAADLQKFWLGLLVGVLLKLNVLRPSKVSKAVTNALKSKNWDLIERDRQVSDEQASLFAALDELDGDLQQEDRYVFVTYDELDRVSPGDWDALKTILQGLVQFWAAYGRRWKRLRPKLFLRRDLYQRAALFGPDIAKIAANRAELLWEVREFYGVLFKRLLNAGQEFLDYLRAAKIPEEMDRSLGRIPVSRHEDGYLAAVALLIGEYMGADPRKGLTLRWIPNHLKDGHGRIYPRPLLRLIEEAAEIEVRDAKAAQTSALIHHTALRGALDKVSEFRVLELANEEFPWVEDVRKSFERRSLLVPMERKEALRALQIDWSNAKSRPPHIDPKDLLDYLVELGIAINRRDGRVDIGDLYLRGLHLKRKGGVARPKQSGV